MPIVIWKSDSRGHLSDSFDPGERITGVGKLGVNDTVQIVGAELGHHGVLDAVTKGLKG